MTFDFGGQALISLHPFKSHGKFLFSFFILLFAAFQLLRLGQK